MNYDMDRAIAILREAHKKMRRTCGSEHPAMADLELAGTRTGAVQVAHKPKRRRRKAA